MNEAGPTGSPLYWRNEAIPVLALGILWLATAPATAVPYTLHYSGIFSGQSPADGPSSYANIGSTYDFQVVFEPLDLTAGPPSSGAGYNYVDYTGMADWYGIIGGHTFSRRLPTVVQVFDGTTSGTDRVRAIASDWTDIFGGGTADGISADTYGPTSTFAGTSLVNVLTLSSLNSPFYVTVQDYAVYPTVHNGWTQATSGTAFAFVPEPSLGELVESL